MNRLMFLWGLLGFTTTALVLSSQPSYGLPGQSVPVVEAWMRSNPTLSPGFTQRLTSTTIDSPYQRFSFQASVLPVVGLVSLADGGVVRTERFSFLDQIHGVTIERLQESLRVIYGEALFNDFRRASRVYQYPSSPATAMSADRLLVGEVREGELFAYWWELAPDAQGRSVTGRMQVFLKADLPLLQDYLEERDS